MVKIADVFLAYAAGRQVLPVETNVSRVANRLGITNSKRYKEIQEKLKSLIPESKRKRAHELLVRLGKDFCKSNDPRCGCCPINKNCSYSH